MGVRGARVAIFEDDLDLQPLLAMILKSEDYEIRAEAGGQCAADVAAQFQPDLAIIDVTLEDGFSGFDVARTLRRADADLPIMFLTGADSLEERLAGFDAGADDYIIKPFATAELVARVHALLRRAGRNGSSVLRFADIEIDESAHLVTRAGAEVSLTATEFDLLRAFVRRPRVVLGKDGLLGDVWGYSQYDTNLVEVHVSSLRRKLEAFGPRVIHTVRSVGYVLRDELSRAV
jgi:DNA-binding response OmpR family regulator